MIGELHAFLKKNHEKLEITLEIDRVERHDGWLLVRFENRISKKKKNAFGFWQWINLIAISRQSMSEKWNE